MAKISALTNSSARDVDVIASSSGTTYYKEGIVGRVGVLDHPVATQRVGTHADDAAFVPGTDAIVAVAALADETATDSVDEGDVGAIRMTLDRRLITATAVLDDAAFGVGTGYVSPSGFLADETGTDSVDEGDVGLARMTLNRRVITAGLLLDDAAFGVATDYVTPLAALADDTTPDSVNEGDIGALRMSLARALHVVNVADVATLSTLASAATSATALAANANRIGATFYNTDANILYLKFGATASLTSFTVALAALTGYFELPSPIYRGVVDAIWSADGTGSCFITELT